MEYSIEFGGAPQDVTVTTSGIGEAAVFVQFVEELVSDPRFQPGMAILVDHSALDTRALFAPDMRVIANEVLSRDDQIGTSLVAIVAPAALTFGLARMWKAYTQAARLRSRIFYLRDDAIAWLTDP